MNIWTYMRIGQRLAIGYAVVLLFLAAVVVVAVDRLDRLAETTRAIVEGDAARATLAGAINLHAESAAGRLLLLFILKDREQRVATYAEIDEHHKAIDAAVKNLAQLLARPEEAAVLKRLETLRKDYREKFSNTVDEIEAGDRATAERLMSGTTRAALTDLLGETSRLAKEQQESMIARQRESVATMVRSRHLVISLGVVALLVGLLLAVFMTRSIARPLRAAVSAADNIAGGDLNTAVPAGGTDEVGQLLTRMGNMQQRLREVIGTINASAGQVAGAADNLGVPSASVRRGSQAQSQLAGQIDRSVSELSAGIRQVVDSAQKTRIYAESARNLARETAQAIVAAAAEITRIAATVSESATSVENLRQSAEKVASAAHVIKEIAEQTNLLALNASIEAARAGESGRGFAVVADEVRKLASRTAEATVHIDQVIATINAQTLAAVDSIHAGRTGMDRGVVLIRGIVGPLGELHEGAQSSLDNLESLTGVAEGQARESGAIANNVHRIVDMAAENRAAAESVARITDELGQLAGQLQHSVDAFRL